MSGAGTAENFLRAGGVVNSPRRVSFLERGDGSTRKSEWDGYSRGGQIAWWSNAGGVLLQYYRFKAGGQRQFRVFGRCFRFFRACWYNVCLS